MLKYRLRSPRYIACAALLLFGILLTSCSPAAPAELDILPLNLDGTIAADGRQYRAWVYFDAPSHGRLTLDDVTYDIDGTAVSMSLAGLTLPAAIMPPALELCRTLTLLTADEIVSTETDGERVTVVYSHENRTVTVVFTDGQVTEAEYGGVRYTAGNE